MTIDTKTLRLAEASHRDAGNTATADLIRDAITLIETQEQQVEEYARIIERIRTESGVRIDAQAVDNKRLREAAQQMHDLYSNVWDRTDGGLVVFRENVERFDAAFESLRAALLEDPHDR